jgi:hypothetical protein
MQAIWNIHEIAKMSDEQRVRNACRQIEQECVEWRRALGFRGRGTSRGEQWTASKRVSLACNGRNGRQYVQICVDGQPTGKRIRVIEGSAVTIYTAIMDARDSLEV